MTETKTPKEEKPSKEAADAEKARQADAEATAAFNAEDRSNPGTES